jgi:hypothetical protein
MFVDTSIVFPVGARKILSEARLWKERPNIPRGAQWVIYFLLLFCGSFLVQRELKLDNYINLHKSQLIYNS